ncbi:MAG: cell wall-active antibiotics response protein [Melioribacteraceae bacterium]|nr:cell wall-active antibiotics response protein [Melioribacteraceae bacterium]MCF8356491.1 cell wall-active antibiotics response protein [Melioribacteraceae bacterium]MCF8394856.1 cell wall-active antibiotics response protein [Melioribacteraceae bacterium]MCF8420584.1 cell wall-active antibiotics response protein [Melioribacteraceae bacterium]
MERSNGRYWIGVILIVIGAVLFLDNMTFFHFPLRHMLFSWPMMLLLIGIIISINSPGSGSGIALILIGGFWLTARYFGYPFWHFFGEYWPVLLIILGGYLLFRKSDDSKNHKMKNHNYYGETDEPGINSGNTDSSSTFGEGFVMSDQDYFDEVAIFSSSRKILSSDNFQGGKATAIFGSVELDLRACKVADYKKIIDTVAMFGSIDLFVPVGWKVVVNVTSIFGGIDDKRAKSYDTTEGSDQVVVIKGLVLFGGMDLRN